MHIHLDPKSQIPIWEQIVNQMKEMVMKGIYQPQDKIPSVRELSSQLIVNPNTVSKAYQELERQGVIETIRGRGTFVAERAPVQQITEQQVEKINEGLKRLIIEATYLGMEEQQVLDMVQDLLKEIGGNNRAERSEHK